MEEQEVNNKKSNNKQTILLILLAILVVSVLITSYLIGYKIGTIGVSSDITDGLDVINLTSSSVDWEKTDLLNIFGNLDEKGRSIIAPGSRGSYRFIVENESEDSITYSLNFKEYNDYNINMKYKLRMNNVYICGSEDTWKKPEELDVNEAIITGGSRTIYTLEWYWEGSKDDSKFGSLEYADYEFLIKFTPVWQNFVSK